MITTSSAFCATHASPLRLTDRAICAISVAKGHLVRLGHRKILLCGTSLGEGIMFRNSMSPAFAPYHPRPFVGQLLPFASNPLHDDVHALRQVVLLYAVFPAALYGPLDASGRSEPNSQVCQRYICKKHHRGGKHKIMFRRLQGCDITSERKTLHGTREDLKLGHVARSLWSKI